MCRRTERSIALADRSSGPLAGEKIYLVRSPRLFPTHSNEANDKKEPLSVDFEFGSELCHVCSTPAQLVTGRKQRKSTASTKLADAATSIESVEVLSPLRTR